MVSYTRCTANDTGPAAGRCPSGADARVRFLAFREWLSRKLAARTGIDGPAERDFTARLEGFLADRVGGIREPAKARMESPGFRIRSSGFGYSAER